MSEFVKRGDKLIDRDTPGKETPSKCTRCRKVEVSGADVYCKECLRETMNELEEECYKRTMRRSNET